MAGGDHEGGVGSQKETPPFCEAWVGSPFTGKVVQSSGNHRSELDAFLLLSYGGSVEVIRRDIHRVEHLAVLCESVTARRTSRTHPHKWMLGRCLEEFSRPCSRYGQEAEILDDGRTIFVSLDDEIACRSQELPFAWPIPKVTSTQDQDLQSDSR